MKKKITFDKTIEFPTMIGEITAISLELDNKLVVYLFFLNLTDKLFQNNKFTPPFKYL